MRTVKQRKGLLLLGEVSVSVVDEGLVSLGTPFEFVAKQRLKNQFE